MVKEYARLFPAVTSKMTLMYQTTSEFVFTNVNSYNAPVYKWLNWLHCQLIQLKYFKFFSTKGFIDIWTFSYATFLAIAANI